MVEMDMDIDRVGGDCEDGTYFEIVGIGGQNH